jgi:hypothetical protein
LYSRPVVAAVPTRLSLTPLTKKKADGHVWAPIGISRGDCNSAGCLLVGTGMEMASSGLGLEERKICPWVLTGLALTWQEERFRAHTHLLTVTTMIFTEL